MVRSTTGVSAGGPEVLRLEEREPDPFDPLASVQARVDALLRVFLDERVAQLRELDPALDRIGTEIAEFVANGGKRLRPAFVYWGHRAAGAVHDDGVLQCAAAVELLHNFALIHDDVMDRSARRRGRPSVHTSLADSHRERRSAGDAEWFGIGGAILAGDLAFVWSDQLFDDAPLSVEAMARARQVFTQLRMEVMAGQYLDLHLAGRTAARDADALRVALLKSGRYTVTRPLQLGAAIADGDPGLHEALRAFGDAIGVAFQLRDDVLGLFGDPDTTGKSALEDLREGKRTLLIVRALNRAGPADRAALQRMLGNPDLDEADARRARRIVRDTGALASVEELCALHHHHARSQLPSLPGNARIALERLADLALFRTV